MIRRDPGVLFQPGSTAAAARRSDAQRRLRLRTALTAVSVFTAAVTLGLAILAQIARDESEVRRVQADRLVNFMLGELRTQLEPVGRLDVLDPVGDEAMSYFEVLQGQGTESKTRLRRSAQVSGAVGESRSTTGSDGAVVGFFHFL